MFYHTQAPKGPQNAVFCPSDLDLQTRPSEQTNTFSTWIWHKSIQQ